MPLYGDMVGQSYFDPYSFAHVLLVFSISWVLGTVFGVSEKRIIVTVFLVMACWEISESKLVESIHLNFFKATETWQNQIVGDTISDTGGYLMYFVGGALSFARAVARDYRKRRAGKVPFFMALEESLHWLNIQMRRMNGPVVTQKRHVRRRRRSRNPRADYIH